MIIIGIGFTFYESLLINENVANQQQNLLVGGSMSLTKELDPSKNQNGVYSVQITDFKENDNVKGNTNKGNYKILNLNNYY